MSDNSSESSRRIALPHTRQPASPLGSRLGKADPGKLIKVSVIVCRKQPLHLQTLEGKHLSHEEFSKKYGADPKSFDALRAFAAAHGLRVDEAASSLARRTLVLEGTVQAMEEAFGVSIDEHEHEGRRFHSYSGTISLPEENKNAVEAVLGLDSRPIAKPHFRRRSPQVRAGAVSESYTPPQVAQIYSFPTGVNGAGETVGILEFGGGYQTADLQTYFQQLGIPTPSVTAVLVDGATNSPGDPNGADGEVMLDIEVVGSVAPGAKIAVYFAPNTEQGFVDAVTTAIHDSAHKPSILSLSWGGPEDSWSQQTLTALDNVFQSAAALGVTVTVASGDNGSSDGETGNHVDFPASSPHVLACGGTELVAQNGKRQKETVWNDLSAGGGASGGGVSASFPLPSWQANANVPAPPSSAGGRGVPDVAGNAAPSTGYQVLVDGQSQVIGGTSAVAPLWAGLLALVNQKRGSAVGMVNQTLYQSGSSDFFDITSGSNGAFSAQKGWDACTGLGAPAGTLLEGLLAGSTAKSG
ncbi:MAG TPA: S53 family peptidase [Acidobacteriaceae bacterium]|nr:S53 family peptidase [Acidobacteriaceae bacterium]